MQHHVPCRPVDLVCHTKEEVRALTASLAEVARERSLTIRLVRDAGTPDLESPPPPLDGVVVESLTDLRAAKLTCILSRSEPRDLVDLMFLDRAGYPPEADLGIALAKDGGIDPGILACCCPSFR